MTVANERKFTKKAGASSRQGQRNNGSSVEFVNRELSAEETADYRQWRDDLVTVDASLAEVCDDGYKISLKYDDYSSAYACFFFADDGSENAGRALTGRGGSPFRALSECLYKHVVLLRGEWSVARSATRPSDDPEW